MFIQQKPALVDKMMFNVGHVWSLMLKSVQ